MVFRAVVFKLLVWCGAEGYVFGLQDASERKIDGYLKDSVYDDLNTPSHRYIVSS